MAAAKKKKKKKKPSWQEELEKTKGGDRDAAFERLKTILRDAAKSKDLVVVHENDKGMLVNFANLQFQGNPMFFGSVAKVQSWVQISLRGIHVWPDLVNKLSPGLQRRLKGKTCFNFNAVDDAQLKELAAFAEATRKAFVSA